MFIIYFTKLFAVLYAHNLTFMFNFSCFTKQIAKSLNASEISTPSHIYIFWRERKIEVNISQLSYRMPCPQGPAISFGIEKLKERTVLQSTSQYNGFSKQFKGGGSCNPQVNLMDFCKQFSVCSDFIFTFSRRKSAGKLNYTSLGWIQI